MPSVAVVSVNYRSNDRLNRCIASLKQNCRGDVRFIVVDNSPVSEIDLIAREHPDVVAIVPERNLGFAGGCNRGIDHALVLGVDYVLLLNPDTRVEHDFIEILMNELEKDDKRGMAGPKIVRDTPGREIWYGGARMNWWLGGPVQIFDQRNDGKGAAQSVPFLSGCVMLIKASVLKAMGHMTEDYFLYYEDTDYSQRIIHAGYDIMYVPSALVIHDASSTVGFQTPNYIYYFSRNRIWFMRRWSRWYHFIIFMLYNTLVKLPGAMIVFGLVRRKPELTTAYFRGYLHGLSRFSRSRHAVIQGGS